MCADMSIIRSCYSGRCVMTSFVFTGDITPSLTVVHIKDQTFELLQPQNISDTHVFLNITGFCKLGLAKKRRKEEKDQSQIRALVRLFLDQHALNVLLLPRNVDLSEVGL